VGTGKLSPPSKILNSDGVTEVHRAMEVLLLRSASCATEPTGTVV
jgi:hypothetical protein